VTCEYKHLKKHSHPSAHRGPVGRKKQTNKKNKASRVQKDAWEDGRNKTHKKHIKVFMEKFKIFHHLLYFPQSTITR